MYWPGMTDDMKQQRESLMSHEITERPWEKIGTDLYTIDGQDYLIVVDYFSNFWEIDHLPNTKASTVINYETEVPLCTTRNPVHCSE